MTRAEVSGLLVVDKPQGLTSHDVVAKVRRVAQTRRVGHTGTLDPMATGVLVLCLGKATRLIPFIEEMGGANAKEYEARIRFGFETTTDDALGEPRGDPMPTTGLTQETVREALRSFVGATSQLPPAFSAKKVRGERAYELARRGEDVVLEAVTVHISDAELLEFDGDCGLVRIQCSRGTYIRAIARDLGRAVGVGAHLVALRRTRSGTARADQGLGLEGLRAESVNDALVPMSSILEDWPLITVAEAEARDLRLGRAINVRKSEFASGARVRLCDEGGELVALAHAEGSRMRPFCVF